MSTKKVMKKTPMRKCIGCQEMKSKKEMIRILKTTGEEVVLDTTGKQNGRGAYLCFSGGCLEQAMKSKGLERSLKMSIPQDIYSSLKKELEEFESKKGSISD